MDVQLVSQTPVRAGLVDRLTDYIAALVASAYVAAKLFKTNVAIGPLTTLAELTEADYAGYAPIVVTSYNGVYVDGAGTPYASTDLLDFVCAGGGLTNTVYAVALVESIGAAATATGTQTGGAFDGFTITSGGTGYQAVPKVVITDATIGTGATAHAVVVGGVITDLIIDTPGTGYTGPIITIERPVKLICGGNFPQGLAMVTNTDAVPTVLEIN